MLAIGRETNLRRRTLGARRGLLAVVTLGVVEVAGAGACASASGATAAPGPSGAGAGVTEASGGAGAAVQPGRAGATSMNANLAGARCHDGRCVCRKGGRDDAETAPPDADHKRFEIRLGPDEGDAVLDSPTLGKFTGGATAETCFYIDVLPGTHHLVTFTAREARPRAGLSPRMRVAEYGPRGPYWYDVVAVSCGAGDGKCTREAALAWGAEAKTRKRGRIDPCGSSVVTHLLWETSGGTGELEGGFYRDFTVTFEMEVKKFATQFAPGSTECVPK